MRYFLEIDKNDISLCKLVNILILFNSEEKLKKLEELLNPNMIIYFNNYDNFYCFLMHYLMRINGTFQTIPRTIVYHRTQNIFFKSIYGHICRGRTNLILKTYISS